MQTKYSNPVRSKDRGKYTPAQRQEGMFIAQLIRMNAKAKLQFSEDMRQNFLRYTRKKGRKLNKLLQIIWIRFGGDSWIPKDRPTSAVHYRGL